jgi:hypothetical protein
VCFCRKSTDLSWERDEPSTTVAEEVTPLAEESAPAPQAVPEPSATEAPLLEASVVEGEYSSEAVELLEEVVVVANTLVFSLTGAEAERSDIPAGVPMQK